MPVETPAKPPAEKPRVEPPPQRREPPATWKCAYCVKTSNTQQDLCNPIRIA